MIVVADTSPLNYLILIERTEILPALFERVIVPNAVLEELLDPLSPLKVRRWLDQRPSWFEVRVAGRMTHSSTAGLGRGEREAMMLALDSGIRRVLIDETKGREVARGLDLEVEGTLGLLERAAGRGLIDFRRALDELDRTNFRVSASIRAAFLERNV